MSSFNAARAFSSPKPDRSRFLPGLDLANDVRQLYAKGDNIAAIKLIRTALDVSLADGLEWYKALTDWTPKSGQVVKPEAAARKPRVRLAEIFEHVSDDMHALYGDDSAGLISDAFYRIAQEIRRAV